MDREISLCNFQVAPAELEAVLLSHPNIVDAAVIPYVHLMLTSDSLFKSI